MESIEQNLTIKIAFEFDIGQDIYSKVSTGKGIIVARKMYEDGCGHNLDYYVRWESEVYLWEDGTSLSEDQVVF